MLFPVRNLSKYGVLADVDPYNLPPEAFSMAVNVRFEGNSVFRAPVFRRVPQTLTSGGASSFTRFCVGTTPTAGFDSVILGYLNGRVTRYKSGVETSLSVFGYADTDADAPWSSCHLGDVLYVNRSDRVPWSLKVTDTIFQPLANWNANWTAKVLRSCNSALVAFGITKSGTTFPTMVKTSEFALVNTVPTTWDNTLPTTNATENTLGEMEGAIIDAQNLGQVMIIYGLNETWLMSPSGDTFVWHYEKLFSDAGAINVNCAVEVDKKHYVFGLNDIWVHDGTSKKSIIDGRNRKFVFSSINLAKAGRCFVMHDRRRNEIRFCYVSGDANTAFSGIEGCNRCAVYNLSEDTWTFDDLPFVFSGATANLDISLTYANVTQTYATIGGTYLDQEDSLKKVAVMVGAASTTFGLSESLYAVDNQGPGSFITYDVDTNATRPVLLERDGIDLDQVADLKGYKEVSSIWPQARLEVGAQPLTFLFGSNDYFNQAVVYGTPQTYDGNLNYQCDFLSGGRYLAMRMTHNDFRYFALTGFDVEIDVLGEV